jgi:hypothetical protein
MSTKLRKIWEIEPKRADQLAKAFKRREQELAEPSRTMPVTKTRRTKTLRRLPAARSCAGRFLFGKARGRADRRAWG